jgi:hypothetical protein
MALVVSCLIEHLRLGLHEEVLLDFVYRCEDERLIVFAHAAHELAAHTQGRSTERSSYVDAGEVSREPHHIVKFMVTSFRPCHSAYGSQELKKFLKCQAF